ncbi:MAG: heme-dependent oxidative N-demethylase subunit alpha family protein [Prosthecobacter sp.]
MPDWFRLLPDASHRLQMNLRPGSACGFWGHSPEAEMVLAERRRWLAETPERYLGILPEGEEAVREAIALIAPHPMIPEEAATQLEPDWIVLSGDAARFHPVIGGAVIFPSGWALEDKIGKPLHEVHAPVPGLQSSLGSQISTFLSRLAPGVMWERDNWGLSADPSLNHHPAVPPRRLDGSATLAATWLRLEQQFLARLPVTGAILFGIRVTNHRLDHLAAIPGLATRLAGALETMSAEIARYKGLDAARGALIAELRG